jgi:hypothetical protein
MAFSTEEQVLLDHLMAKQRQDKIDNPQKYQRGNKKLIVFKVLDASTSMSSYLQTTISTYNESLDALKEAEAEVHVVSSAKSITESIRPTIARADGRRYTTQSASRSKKRIAWNRTATRRSCWKS